MSTTITVTPTSPKAVSDACRVDVASLPENSGESDVTKYPVQAEERCYLAFVKGGVEYGRSYVFSGDHQFNSYVFPSAGSWVVHVKKVADDTDVTTQAVTVQ